jgi:hypothetical protein
VIAENVAEPRAQTAVLSLFGAVSLLLAALGVAGVTAYAWCGARPSWRCAWRWAPPRGAWCGT